MRKIIPIVVAMAGFSPFCVSAQWVVTDPIAETNLVLQYAAMLDEIVVMKEHLEEAKKSLSLSKDQLRALGEGVSDLGREAIEDYGKDIPSDWRSVLAEMTAANKVGSIAKEIRSKSALTDRDYFSGVPDELKSDLDARMDREIASQAINSAAMDASGDRFQRFEALRDSLDGARDLKSISDLQARIQIENGMLMNELVRLQAMNQVMSSDKSVREQSGRQREFEMTQMKY